MYIYPWSQTTRRLAVFFAAHSPEAIQSLKYSKGICSRANCIGSYCTAQKKWVVYPHDKKDCPFTWRKFAKKKFREIKFAIDKNKNWHHLCLKTRMAADGDEPQRSLASWQKAVAELYPGANMIWVKHSGHHHHLHYHIMLGCTAAINVKLVRRLWRECYPCWASKPWDRYCARGKPHGHPVRLLRYLLGLSWNRAKGEYRRKNCPWRATKGCVVRVYRT